MPERSFGRRLIARHRRLAAVLLLALPVIPALAQCLEALHVQLICNKPPGADGKKHIKISFEGSDNLTVQGALSAAETAAPDFEKMSNGARYALYLAKRPAGGGDVSDDPSVSVYGLSVGPQGLFELTADGKVRSHAKADRPVASATKDKDVFAFLAEIRAQARKHPRPGKCCE